jgi:hypothetical protein
MPVREETKSFHISKAVWGLGKLNIGRDEAVTLAITLQGRDDTDIAMMTRVVIGLSELGVGTSQIYDFADRFLADTTVLPVETCVFLNAIVRDRREPARKKRTTMLLLERLSAMPDLRAAHLVTAIHCLTHIEVCDGPLFDSFKRRLPPPGSLLEEQRRILDSCLRNSQKRKPD